MTDQRFEGPVGQVAGRDIVNQAGTRPFSLADLGMPALLAEHHARVRALQRAGWSRWLNLPMLATVTAAIWVLGATWARFTQGIVGSAETLLPSWAALFAMMASLLWLQWRWRRAAAEIRAARDRAAEARKEINRRPG